MLRTAYEHPPRKLKFYLRYIGYTLLTVSPIVLAYILFSFLPGISFPPISMMPPFIFLAIMIIVLGYRALMHIMVLIEDSDVDKSNDVTAFNYAPPSQLDETLLYLELNGFERFAEVEVAIGIEDPLIIWKLTKDDGKIIAEVIFNSKNSKHFMGFVTYTTTGLVITYYGNSTLRRQQDNKLRIVAISTGLDDALAYHIFQVSEITGSADDVITIESLEHYNDVDNQFKQTNVLDYQDLLWLFVKTRMLLSVFALVFPSFLLSFFHPLYAIIPAMLALPSFLGLRALGKREKPIDPTKYLKQHDIYPKSLLEVNR